jgi:hypothetical protein
MEIKDDEKFLWFIVSRDEYTSIRRIRRYCTGQFSA